MQRSLAILLFKNAKGRQNALRFFLRSNNAGDCDALGNGLLIKSFFLRRNLARASLQSKLLAIASAIS